MNIRILIAAALALIALPGPIARAQNRPAPQVPGEAPPVPAKGEDQEDAATRMEPPAPLPPAPLPPAPPPPAPPPAALPELSPPPMSDGATLPPPLALHPSHHQLEDSGVCAQPMLGPTELGLRDDGMDDLPDPCGRSVLDVHGRASALLDVPEFYGTLAGSLLAAVRYQQSQSFAWEIGFRALEYRFAQNASVALTERSYGPVFVGAARLMSGSLGSMPVAWAPSVRMSLPFTDTGYEVATMAIRPALGLAIQPTKRLQAHLRAAVLVWLASSIDHTRGRMAGQLALDATVAIARSLAVSAGAEVAGGWYEHGLDHVLARAAVRVRVSTRYRLDLGAALPLEGATRVSMVLRLGLSRDL